MATFTLNSITVQGLNIIAKLVAGSTLEFTRIAVGDGAMPSDKTPLTVTDLSNRLFDVPINRVESDGNQEATVSGIFDNKGLETGFFYRELGLFAKDPTTKQEVLYCYGNAAADAEWIPPSGASSIIEKQVKIVTLVGNAEKVTAQIKSGIYPTIDQVQAWLNNKYDKTGGPISGDVQISGEATIANGLDVDGGAVVDTITVEGTTTLNGATTATEKLTANGGIDTNALMVGGDLTANGVATIGSTLQVKTAKKTSKAIEIVDGDASAGGFYIYGHGGLTGLGSGASLQNVKNGLNTDFGGRDSTYKATFITAEKEIYLVSHAASYGSRLVHALTHAGLDAIAHNYTKGQSGIGAETHISLNDKGGYMTGNRIAAVELKGGATGNQGVYLRAYKNAAGSSEQGTISIAFDWAKNLFVTSAPTPPHTDKSTQIATTAWVKDLIATTSEYGLMKVATPETAINPDENDAAITPAVYHDVSDFRHKGTAYSLGDKVECMFNHELFLECTKAGTTASTPLDTRNVKHGQVLTDGGVQWTVRTHIKSVNGIVAGANGNVEIEIPKPPVTSVNGQTGAVTITIPQAVIAGTVIAFAGNSVPSGYIPCNGAAVSRTTYAALFKAIGTTYGAGDGSTTFTLPNAPNGNLFTNSTITVVEDGDFTFNGTGVDTSDGTFHNTAYGASYTLTNSATYNIDVHSTKRTYNTFGVGVLPNTKQPTSGGGWDTRPAPFKYKSGLKIKTPTFPKIMYYIKY